MSTSLILTVLAVIFFVNAFWLLFHGSYAESSTRQGNFKTYEFENNPIGYSCSVGIILVLAFTCLHFGNPHFFAVAVKKLPQLKILITIGKMQYGMFYLLGGGFVASTLLAFILRRSVTVSTSLTKGHDLDLDSRTVKKHKDKMEREAPNWQKEGKKRQEQSPFDDGTPL